MFKLLWKCEENFPESLLGKSMPLPLTWVRVERGVVHQSPALLFALALAGLLLAGAKPRALLLPPAIGLAAYCAIFPLLQLGFTRYSLPALPGLIALAAIGMERLYGSTSGWKNLAQQVLPSRREAGPGT